MARAQHEEDWRQFAACLDIDPEIPFMDTKSPVVKQFVREVCGRCLVREECLRFALEAGCHYGVFGGKMPGTRAKMPKPRQEAPCGTQAGYRRHKRAGQEACPPCLLAARLYDQGRRMARMRRVIEVPFNARLDEAA